MPNTPSNIIQIATECILAKCEGRTDDLIYWSELFVRHPHQGPAKEIFFDMLPEALGTDSDFYRDFLAALEDEVA